MTGFRIVGSIVVAVLFTAGLGQGTWECITMASGLFLLTTQGGNYDS